MDRLQLIQENVVCGGRHGKVVAAKGAPTRMSVREVTGIDQGRALNPTLWVLTKRLAELCRGGEI